MDADHVGNLSAPVGAPASRHAIGAMVAQAGNELATQLPGKRHLKAVSTSTLSVSKVMSITSSSGDHFDDRDRQCWKPQGAAELRA
jgi:hypothetical protein